MSKKKHLEKSLQFYGDEANPTNDASSKENQLKNGVQQVFLQQSVTILAFKDNKGATNGTLSPVLEPQLYFGFLSEDLPLFVCAIIGAALILVIFLFILSIWKCCRMQWRRQKYWLHTKNTDNTKAKSRFSSVVQSHSVVFLGVKSSQARDLCKMEKSAKTPSSDNFFENHEVIDNVDSIEPYPVTCSSNENIIRENIPAKIREKAEVLQGPTNSLPQISIPVICTPTDQNFVNCNVLVQNGDLNTLNMQNSAIFSVHAPCVLNHSLQSSPAFFHRAYCSGTFDQHSLYSCTSDIDLKTCKFTWSSYNLRPLNTGDGYYDLFQRASLCKKRKNRMRSDIAAAIALNRSQSTNMNIEKDTDSLVENEVEIVLDERTTL